MAGQHNLRGAAVERAAYLGASAAAFLGVFFIASELPVDQSDAEAVFEEISKIIDTIDSGDGIFVHNAALAAVMFVPGVGAAWGMITAASTGYAFASVLYLNPDLQLEPLRVFLTPFGALELFAYSLAISRSILITKALLARSNLRRNAAYTVAELTIMTAALYAAGHVEYSMLNL